MTKAEARKQWEDGGRILNVKYVIGRAENIMCRNKLDPGGARVARPVVKHTVLIGKEPATVTDWKESGFDVANYVSPYVQLQDYHLVFQTVEQDGGNVSFRGVIQEITVEGAPGTNGPVKAK